MIIDHPHYSAIFTRSVVNTYIFYFEKEIFLFFLIFLFQLIQIIQFTL